MNAAAISERTSELLVRFYLTTAAAELAGRLEQAGQHEALRLVLEVLEMEAEAREQRKIARLRRVPNCPRQDFRHPRPQRLARSARAQAARAGRRRLSRRRG